MDSANSSSEMCFPKIEMDYESDREGKRDLKMVWTSDNTRKLIDTFEMECKELWDTKHPSYKDRRAKRAKLEYLANMFATTSEEISRKIHNLRTQFNNELRKIKRRQTGGGEMSSVVGGSGWEYFDALSFLLRSPFEPLEAIDGVNLALAEFQADEEEKFGMAARAGVGAHVCPSSMNRHRSRLAEFQADEEEEFGAAARARSLVCSSPQNRQRPRVAASAPPPLPPSAHPMMWPEEAVPRLRPSINADECQIFGDFVASELRMLRSDESRKRLKRMIQKAILQIGEEEDVNMLTG